MAFSHFRMLIHELLNKDSDIVPKEAPIITLDRRFLFVWIGMVRIPSTYGTFLEEYI